MHSHARFLALAASLFLFTGLTTASEARAGKGINLKPPANAQQDDGSATHLLYQTKNPDQKAAGGLKVATVCTDALGMTHKQGDAGYVGCARTQDRLQPDTGKGKRTNSVGISIGD